VGARVGSLLHPDHYLKGYHPTASVGVFSAAAASAKLLKLNTEQIQAALGLAATQACGLKCVFGTMAKPFNAGNASASGMLAAKLVASGFTAPIDALEAEKGYLDMFIGLPRDERDVGGIDNYRIHENMFKFDAACHATHAMIGALQDLIAVHGIDAETIESVHVTASTLSLKTASIGVPKTGLECKFSYSQVAAFVLAGLDPAADESYRDEILSHELVNRYRELVKVEEAAEISPLETTVTIRLKTGEKLQRYFNFKEEVMDNTERVRAGLESKFLANTRSYVGEDAAVSLMGILLNIDNDEDCWDAFAGLAD
jgi:2-methylcitrate dehydratase PrpD